MDQQPKCPKCAQENTYYDASIMLYVCTDCFNEWNNEQQDDASNVARDSNGTELADGDSVTIIKDLKVRGSSLVLKRGTKVKSIKLTDNPEEVDCRIDGTSLVLKACFLKKG